MHVLVGFFLPKEEYSNICKVDSYLVFIPSFPRQIDGMYLHRFMPMSVHV